MKKITIIITAVALIMASCSKDPVADFTYGPLQPWAGEEVSFTNLSYDAESFQWEFDDGYSSSSYEPVHAFNLPGTYNVTLKAFGKKSGFDVAYASIVVTSLDPYADFYITTKLQDSEGAIMDVETDIVFVGEQITFNNVSQDAASVLWEFGDDYTSTVISPTYSYDSPGTYTITLNAYGLANEVDSYSKTIKVYEGINSNVRITVKEWYQEYAVEGASVLLFPTLDDWINETNYSQEEFTTKLGKCVFEGLAAQRYYVDVLEDFHNNYDLAAESTDYIETQILQSAKINDFIAWVDYTGTKKIVKIERLGRAQLSRGLKSDAKPSAVREFKENKFVKDK